MAESLNSDQIITKPATVLDQNFYVPQGLLNVETASKDADDYLDVDTVLEFDADDLLTPSPTGTDIGMGNTSGLQVPQTSTIVSQTMRILANGSAVVDVLIDVEDIQGITNYEIRLTKT